MLSKDTKFRLVHALTSEKAAEELEGAIKKGMEFPQPEDITQQVEDQIEQYLQENPIEGFEPAPGKLLCIDRTRPDTYTANGSFDKPFKTIMEAINFASGNGDGNSVPYSFTIASGTYNETIDLSGKNLFSVTISGLGRVAIVPATGSALVSSSSNSILQDLVINNIEFGKEVAIEGDGTASQFKTTEFRNCAFTGQPTQIVRANNIAFINCYSEVAMSIFNTNYCVVRNSQFNQDLTFETNSTVTPLPANGLNNGGMVVIGSVLRSIVQQKTGTHTTNFAINGSRVGAASTSYVNRQNTNFFAYASQIRGNWENNGVLNLRASFVEGDITGTPAVFSGNKSGQMAFIATTPANWSGLPVSLEEAVNRLANEIATLKGGPIS
jgi:hypothetical protein